MNSKEIRIDEFSFDVILKDEKKIIIVEDNIKTNDIIQLREDGYNNRMLYARVIEAYPMIRHKNVNKFFFWSVKVPYMSYVVRFELTGMIQIEGQTIGMSNSNTEEIYHNIQSSDTIDLSRFPSIIFTNDKGEFLRDITFFKGCLTEDKKMVRALSYFVDGDKSKEGEFIVLHTKKP